jgi:outer membrane protein assembly factor BamB
LCGFLRDTVVASGQEFFEPEETHDTPEEPLRTEIYGIESASGDVRWTTAFDGVSTVTVGADRAYVAHGGGLSAIGADGVTRWTVDTADPITDLQAIGSTIVAAEGSELVGYSAIGERSWTVDLAARHLVPDGERVYAMDENVAAVTVDGTVAWRHRVYGNGPLLAGDRLYTRTAMRMNAIDAFSLPDGERQFRFQTPSNNGWPLAATADTLVAEAITPDLADFTSLFALDAASGQPQAVYRPADTVFTAEGLHARTYVGLGDGRIGVFADP